MFEAAAALQCCCQTEVRRTCSQCARVIYHRAFYTRKCRNFTIDGLENLGIAVKYLDRINSALIATAITYLVVAVVIFLMSLWRSFIEAAHDAVGECRTIG